MAEGGGKLPGVESQPDVPEATPAVTADTTIVVAALLETLILLGGLYWAVTADVGISMPVRILLVALAAVLCAAGVVLAVVKRSRPNH